MSTDSNAVTGAAVDAQVAPAALPATRPLYWSVRRELWENRSLYVAPLGVAALVLFGFLISLITLPGRVRAAAALAPALQEKALAMPYSVAASMILLTAFVVGAFYCLDALYGERRDRSILFWKSLPVSDLTTVLAKACIPLVVLPLFALAIVVAIQMGMLFLSTVVLLPAGDAGTLWARVPLLRMTAVMVYGVAVYALWLAPLYAWLLMVSAWARRLPILWAVAPPMALGAVEKMAFDTQFVCSLLQYRLMGPLVEAFDFKAQPGAVPLLRPLNFLTTPGLWVGLAVAVAFLAMAVRLRRHREPI